MKLQNLAVIFIIIALPISVVLSTYIGSQIQTLQYQISYDTKLQNATYDALKAFQLNTVNSSTSTLANSKLRDLEASANTFFNSVSSNFNMAGYNKDILKDFVPALVYTMYDGFYIYSPYTNKLTDDDWEGDDASTPDDETSTYTDGQSLTGFKPYIHYSCRYKKETTDVVITYSLDNYITVEGIDTNGKSIYISGYLLNTTGNNISVDSATGVVTYRGVNIKSEELKENAYSINDANGNYDYSKGEIPYVKINGVKHYKEADNKWYTILNGEKYYDEAGLEYNTTDTSGKRYYEKAKEFRDTLDACGITGLQIEDAYDFDGTTRLFPNESGPIFTEREYRGSETVDIEEPNSSFNEHRLKVIRKVIEKNLSLAIHNYNEYLPGNDPSTTFQMPKLKEDEWDRVVNNVCIISFLQGLNIGGKIYNGYSIVTNDKNEEVVKEESIYIANDTTYYKVTKEGLNEMVNSNSNNYKGFLNIDFEMKKIDVDTRNTILFPKNTSGRQRCYKFEKWRRL